MATHDAFYDHIEAAADRIIRGFFEALTMAGIVAVVGFIGFCMGSWQ